MNIRLFLKTSIIIILVVILSNPLIIKATTLDEIQQQINQQQSQLDQINQTIAALNKTIADNKTIQGSYGSEISKVKATIDNLQSQLSLLDLQRSQIADQINLKSLEKDEKTKLQDNQVIDSYITWKTANGKIDVSSDILKQAVYFESYQSTTKGQILSLSQQIDQLTVDKTGFELQMTDLNRQIADAAAQKALLDQQVSQYNSAVSNANASLSTMRANAKGVTQNIDQLTKEQEQLIAEDNKITSGGTGGTDVILTGEFYFSGTGRDLYQGHGVGLSQWGAFGAAKNHGYSANQILKLYYTGVTIDKRAPATISVQGYGTMSLDDYVAGLGEIPDKACGTSNQILQWAAYSDNMGWSQIDPRRSKYVLDNPNTVWDCWPEETIKAQVIAARTYAITSGQPICTTAACQVYKGGQGKAWAAWETSNEYVDYNGQPIRAYYSSDNSQGYGTANNDTVFSGYDGIGWPLPYVQHVDDTAVSGSYQYTNWAWRTNGYTISQINDMLTYEVSHYNLGSSANSFIKGIQQKVGTITSLSLTRDSSRRVRYLTLSGPKGSANIQGELFKYIWNDWVAGTHASNQQDYIYSITFSFQQK